MSAASDPAAATMAQDSPKLGEKFAAQSFGPCSLDDLQRYASASGEDAYEDSAAGELRVVVGGGSALRRGVSFR